MIITFVIPVLNEEKVIFNCLDSIYLQKFSSNITLRTIVYDSGCTDSTIDVIKKNFKKVKIKKNKKKRAEFALLDTYQNEETDLIVCFAADNILRDFNWVSRMVEPFTYVSNLHCAFTNIEVYEDSNTINKYYSDLHVEPFTWFVYGEKANPKFFKKYFKIIHEHKNYCVFQFDENNHPLIALAQGFIFKKNIRNLNLTSGDDIMPFLEMVKRNYNFCYVKNLGIEHKHVESYSDFNNKYRKRIINNVYNKHGFQLRENSLNKIRKFKSFLFLIYSLTIIIPIFKTLYEVILKKRIYFKWHIILCLNLSLNIIGIYIGYLLKKLFRNLWNFLLAK